MDPIEEARSLTRFIKDRLDEEERAIPQSSEGDQRRAELTFKRKILERRRWIDRNPGESEWHDGYSAAIYDVLVAAVKALYADHPDFRPEWLDYAATMPELDLDGIEARATDIANYVRSEPVVFLV